MRLHVRRDGEISKGSLADACRKAGWPRKGVLERCAVARGAETVTVVQGCFHEREGRKAPKKVRRLVLALRTDRLVLQTLLLSCREKYAERNETKMPDRHAHRAWVFQKIAVGEEGVYKKKGKKTIYENRGEGGEALPEVGAALAFETVLWGAIAPGGPRARRFTCGEKRRWQKLPQRLSLSRRRGVKVRRGTSGVLTFRRSTAATCTGGVTLYGKGNTTRTAIRALYR